MDIELIKQLLGTGGSTAVSLVLIYWWMKDKRETNEIFATKIESVINKMADKFSEELATTRKAWQGQIQEITTQLFNTQINTSATLTRLWEAIQELRQRIEKS